MILEAFLKLDSAAFTSGVGSAMEGIKGIIRIAGSMQQHLTEAFDLGGALSDLAAQTGDSAGDLLVMQRAFDDAGIGADALGQTVAILRKNLSDVGGSGQGDLLKKLGLDQAALASMGVEEQFDTIGKAINGLASPTDKSAAAMQLFGRSGAQMLTLFADSNALENARATLGSLPDIMDKNAGSFDAISDRFKRLKQASMGIWAGLAEGLAPTFDAIGTVIESVDIAAIGRKAGAVLGTVVELFRTVPLGDALLAALDAGWTGFLNLAIEGLARLGLWFGDVLEKPITWLRAAFQKVIEEVIELIGKIPGIGKALGIDGFQAGSFSDLRQEQIDTRRQRADEMRAAIDAGDWKYKVSDRTAELWQNASDAFTERLDAVNAKYAGDKGGGGGDLGAAGTGAKAGSATASITDALTRIGGYMGGGGGSSKLENLADKQLNETKAMRRALEKMTGSSQVGVWG